MKKCICAPMTPSLMHENQLDGIWTFTIPNVHTRALTAVRLIKSTSPSCHSARQRNHGRRSTYRRGFFVQKNGAGAHDALRPGGPATWRKTLRELGAPQFDQKI